MATYTRQPQKLVDWIAADKELPQFLAGYLQAYLATHSIAADVSVSPDGTIAIDTDATGAAVTAALGAITENDIDPEKVRDTARAAMMAALDAYADAVEAGQVPTNLQTQQAVARLIRAVQYIAERLP